MGDDEMLVEFRHSSWYEEDVRDEVLSFLEEHGMSLVVVDAPKVEAKNVPRTLLAVTGLTVYVRFHGRNEKTWNSRGGAPPSGSTTSTPRTSCASGWSLCASSPGRRRTPTRSSTTTTAHRVTAATADMSRRVPRTRRCSADCLQKLRQQLVEAVPALDVREVAGALEHLEAAVRRRLDDLPGLGWNGSSLPTTTQSGRS